jgi:hypothetical protein
MVGSAASVKVMKRTLRRLTEAESKQLLTTEATEDFFWRALRPSRRWRGASGPTKPFSVLSVPPW